MNYNLAKKIENLVAEANFSLREDVLFLLKNAYLKEKDKKAKQALFWILENAKIAKKESLAICQDTGLALIFIEVGKNESITYSLIDTIKKSVASSYKKNYLRASIVEPLKREKPSYRGGIIHIEFNSKIKGLRISILPKGFGSENKSALRMFNPTAKIDDIEDFVIESVKKAGPQACPPFIVGVGIGGTSDYALLLAKKALLSNLIKPNKDKMLDKIEKRLLKKINALNIGPMGLGGKCTALAVKIKLAPTHIAGLPVGLNISCHALRSASVKIVNFN
ncbi:MAG: fumarate hydratase [Candidatus Omnitrophica bacterium]|nr:fumarate hydratase [Candidatus Omnitrophota bacterium]